MVRLIIGILMVLVGGCAGIGGLVSLSGAEIDTAEPELVTVNELIQRKGQGNRHVRVDQFRFGSDVCIIYREKKKRESHYDRVYIPILPPGDDADPIMIKTPPKDIKLILICSSLHNQRAIDEFGNRTTISGMVTDGFSSLTADDRKLVRQVFPAVDLENCVYIKEGERPVGRPAKMMMAILGGALVLGGGLLALFGILSLRRGDSRRSTADRRDDDFRDRYEGRGRSDRDDDRYQDDDRRDRRDEGRDRRQTGYGFNPADFDDEPRRGRRPPRERDRYDDDDSDRDRDRDDRYRD